MYPNSPILRQVAFSRKRSFGLNGTSYIKLSMQWLRLPFLQEKTSENVKDQFDGFYDFNQPDTETSAEPEVKSSDTESIIAKAIENENEITKVLEKSKKSRSLNRQNSISQVLQKNEQNHDSDGGSPRKGRILTRQNSFKSVKKFFQVNITLT